jgi:hypothetical protein
MVGHVSRCGCVLDSEEWWDTPSALPSRARYLLSCCFSDDPLLIDTRGLVVVPLTFKFFM